MPETPIRKFSAPAMEIIRRRRSVRTYSSRPLTPELEIEIRGLIERVEVPFGTPPRLILVDRGTALKEKRARLGTYGFIVGARRFIAAVVPAKDPDLVALGRALEDVILSLTDRGLGTCWLGGTFSRSSFGRALALGPGELVPAVTPFGFASKLRAPVDLLIKPDPLARPRLPWRRLFFDGGFTLPLAPETAGAFAPALEAVRLAPSASNRQPWRVIREEGAWHFYLRHDPAYAARFSFDLQRLDIGIALCHFELVAREAGLAGRWVVRAPSLAAPARHEYIVSWEN